VRGSERRVDPFTGRSVVIAPDRRWLGATRPGGPPTPEADCPFCPGGDAEREATIARWPAEGPWRVRVVHNKFPLATMDTERAEGIPARGVHEIGVDAPEHDADLADLSVEQAIGMWRTYRDRVAALEARDGMRAVVLYRNRGRRAGSSQPHPHTQIAALDWVPFEVRLRWDLATAHLRERGESVHSVELRRELEGPRMLSVDDRVVTFCPFAPSRPFEIRLAPRAPTGGFRTATDEDIASLATQLVGAATRLRRATAIADYNLVLRQPLVGASGPAVAWHLELLPRTGGDAGFELAADEMIVVVPPEDAARELRGEP
jgi:UDPglucose--hexose-1-phosphate uridylyltransferase